MTQGYISLRNVEYFVLDEADRMLDMGFIHDVKKLLAVLPKRRQSLFFSATMPPEIVKLADTILDNPKKVEVTPVSSTAEKIQQAVYFIDRGNKNKLLYDLLQDSSIKAALVFTRTKHGADKVVKFLASKNITARNHSRQQSTKCASACPDQFQKWGNTCLSSDRHCCERN